MQLAIPQPRIWRPRWLDALNIKAQRSTDGKFLRTSDGKLAGEANCGGCNVCGSSIGVVVAGVTLVTVCCGDPGVVQDRVCTGSVNGSFTLSLNGTCFWSGLFSGATVTRYNEDTSSCITPDVGFSNFAVQASLNEALNTWQVCIQFATSAGVALGCGAPLLTRVFQGSASGNCGSSTVVSNSLVTPCPSTEDVGSGGTVTITP